MNFRTILNSNEITPTNNKIDYQSKIGLIGSCFVENIGEKLEYFRFQNWINPFGILFQPLAIEKAIESIVNKRFFLESDLVRENGLWHSLHHHSKFSGIDKDSVLNTINKSILTAHNDLKSSSHIIITLGTAWVYHHIASDQLVANCHKISQKEFVKRILTIDEISKSLENSIKLIKRVNPSTEIILTLSPVRHLKDGMLANSRSKAVLLAAIHQVVESSNCIYFPSYEILQDDLRDYRFYKSDMVHPNKTSILYIWEYFKTFWLSRTTEKTMKLVDKTQKGLKHKAFNPNSDNHLSFLKNLEKDKIFLLENFKIRM